MKKVLAIILALVLIAALASCSSTTTVADTGSETSTTANQGGPGGTPPDGPGGTPPDGPGGQGGPGGSNSEVVYKAATEVTSSTSEEGKAYSSSSADESALMISTSDDVTVSNFTLTKSGDSDGGDNCNFYGQNAALLVKDGATATITGGTITSDASGANGVFCYGGNGGQNG
ncbi:MAG: hypothetical protein J6Z79_06115, partial [Clostridia bacterium]|nr:hypothetical protein [Clostridia bacterium]